MRRRHLLATPLALGLPKRAAAQPAETRQIRIAQQFGLIYLPFIVLREQRLLEGAVKAAGLPEPEVSWIQVSGGAAMNDALLSGGLDIAAAGVPPFVLLWARTRSNLRVRSLGALGSQSIWLNTNRSEVKTIADFTERDRIALPAVRVSFQSIVLQMAAEKLFGPGQHGRLDPITVSLPHPDATAQLIAGRTEITAHFGNPPFQQQQLQHPGIHRVLDSFDVLGGAHSGNLAYATGRWHDANPRTAAAFVAALDAAHRWIRENRRAAAELYVRAERSPLDAGFVDAILGEAGISFTSAPARVLAFAEFQQRSGQIPVKPANWQELFFPALHNLGGS
ncbi:ABC transporter substrate-binding protein [Roseomonas sp. KE2513]|uniref:ABC transporter substrate-binding protein n=1 Tax=Roseomonas sp. KE2513 TaxID=2479202 RepID=UPI0018DFFE8D|nr:ABC transporter substrate-binding protein [Roseomonas sp. KE2513]MBI0538542.1 ABC transporter substrate-binding protein [Roseomonas sp. KE2513]